MFGADAIVPELGCLGWRDLEGFAQIRAAVRFTTLDLAPACQSGLQTGARTLDLSVFISDEALCGLA